MEVVKFSEIVFTLEMEYETPNLKSAAYTSLQGKLKMAIHVRLNRRTRQRQERRQPRWPRDPRNPLENPADDEIFERCLLLLLFRYVRTIYFFRALPMIAISHGLNVLSI